MATEVLNEAWFIAYLPVAHYHINSKFTLKVSIYEYFIKFGEQTKKNPLKAAVYEILLSRLFYLF